MIIFKEEIEKAFVEAVDNMNKLVPMDEFDTLCFNKGFYKAIEVVEEKIQEYIGNIVIENQGLKLYKDNEAERFKELAVEFIDWISAEYYKSYHDNVEFFWMNSKQLSTYTSQELYNLFKKRNK